MDDLDHSIHIAENDWISFYDDSEECNLLQASLAVPDDSSLSDSEDSGNFNTGQQETNGSPDSNTAEESCTGGIQLVEQLFQSDVTCMKQEEISVSCPETNTISTKSADKEIAQEILAETSDGNTNTPQTNPLSNYNSEGRGMLSRDGAAQMTSDLKSNKKPDLLSCKQAAPSASEPDATGRAEKERWFVTVNDNLAWRRGRSTPVKKKLKQKSPGEGENVQNSDTKREREQSRGIQLNRNKEPGDLSEERLISRSVAAMNRDKREPGSSAHTSYDSFSPSPTALERLQCSELRHGAEFSSTSSWDSDSYLSAVESVEEAQDPLEEHFFEHLPLQCPTCDNQNVSLTLSIDATAANYDGYATPEPPFTPPSPEIPDENSTYGNDTCSESHPPPSPSGGAWEDQLSPDSAQSLCSAADSPETFAKAAGQAQPVYAISAFWDEVEKLTINDILQIKKGISCRLTEETTGPDASDLPTDPIQGDPLDNSMMDTSDAADSDYFTQPDESKRDRSVCEFSTSDFEEESWQFANLSKNSSPDLQNKPQRSDSCLFLDEDDSSDYERRETPVTLDQSLDCQHFQNVISCQRRMTKSRSMYNVQVLTTEDVAPLPSLSIDQNDLPLGGDQPLETLLSHTDLQDYRISFPEIFEYFFTESDDNTPSQFLSVRDPEEMFVSRVFHSPLCTFREDPWTAPFQCSTEKPIPIFSCSRPAVQDLTFPNPHVFLSTDCEEEDKVSPMRLMSHSFFHHSPHRSSGAAGVGGSHSWKSFLSLRKIRFPDKGSICCSESGAWIFPVDTEEIRMGSQNQAVTSLSERRACLGFPQEFRELEEQCWVSETVWTTKREGLFSRVKQSDVCLVCIAFASWVLRSSNPEAADAWKAALLANVSALSAIQYLRQYMAMKNPPRDDL